MIHALAFLYHLAYGLLLAYALWFAIWGRHNINRGS